MAKDLMATAKPYHIFPGKFARRISPNRLLYPGIRPYLHPGFALVAYPNRDSTLYKERYNIPEAETIIRGVRHPLISPSGLCKRQQTLPVRVMLTPQGHRL
jgi:hypothetical protein